MKYLPTDRREPMARSLTSPAGRTLIVRQDAKDRALRQALKVPWHWVHDAACSYSDWQVFALLVRAMCETQGEQIAREVDTELRRRCPGFLEWEQCERTSRPHGHSVWRCLVNWIADHIFAEAHAEGWYDAVMHFGYKQLRTVQAWGHWQRTGAEWKTRPPGRSPTLAQWTEGVDSTTELVQEGDEDARRAVAALALVPSERLCQAVERLLDARGFALWVSSVSETGLAPPKAIIEAVLERCPKLADVGNFFQLARCLDVSIRTAARQEGWLPALRYQVIHHPRYHRLIHYGVHCRTECSSLKPRSVPTYSE